MKKPTKRKDASGASNQKPALDRDMDDSMFKLSVMKRTVFFLAMAANPSKDETARLSPVLEEMAKELLTELAVEIANCRAMRDVLNALIAKLGAARILELLDGTPADIERFRARERQKPEPSSGQ